MLTGRQLPGVSLKNCRMNETVWAGAELEGACFANAAGEATDFRAASLVSTDWTGDTMAAAVFGQIE